MKKVILGLFASAALVACNQAQQPLARGPVAPGAQLGAQSATTEGHSDAFARKLANPKAYRFSFNDDSSTRTVCGDTDDLQNVEDFKPDPTSPNAGAVKQASSSVGALAMGQAGPNSRKFCSGTLISENLFITASHCVDGDITSNFAVFNYQSVAGSNGKQLRQQTHVPIKRIVEDGGYNSGGFDYAILELEGTPGKTFGFKKVAPATLTRGTPIFDVQHPRGWPKKVHDGQIEGTRGSKYVTYIDMDTHGGSSGSGVLNYNGEVAAIHTNGGCRRSGGANAGVPVSLIVKQSKVLQSLAR